VQKRRGGWVMTSQRVGELRGDALSDHRGEACGYRHGAIAPVTSHATSGSRASSGLAARPIAISAIACGSWTWTCESGRPEGTTASRWARAGPRRRIGAAGRSA